MKSRLLTVDMGLATHYEYWGKDGTIRDSLQEAGGGRVRRRRSWKERVLDEARLNGDRRSALEILEDDLELLQDVKQVLMDGDKSSSERRRHQEKSRSLEFS